MQYYDHSKQIPALGFGACLPPFLQMPTHCFALNGDIFHPECDGLEGVIEAYKNALKQVNNQIDFVLFIVKKGRFSNEIVSFFETIQEKVIFY